MWNKKAVLGFVFLLLGLGTFTLFSMPAHATGGINPTISFEGKIVNNNGTNIADGTYNMEFKIYSGASNVGTGDTLLFTEDWLVGSTQGGIALTSGTYEVNLGSAGAGDSVALSSLNFNQYPLWLSLQIGNTSSCTIVTNFQTNCGGDTEMKPYIQFTSTPYSFTAGQIGYTNSGFVGTLSFASTLSGTDTITIPDASGFVCLQSATACGFAASSGSGNYIQNQNSSPQSTANFDISGTGQASAFDASSAATLNVGTTTATGVTIGKAVSTSTVTVNDALTISGDIPAAVVGNGTAATTVLNVTGGKGGNTSGTSNTAGAGAGLTLQGGTGGDAVAGSGTSTAGAGGSLTIQAGNGGVNSFGTATNGNGGSITLSAGAVGTGGTGGSNGSVIVKNQANSSTAFEIQNTAGLPIFLVDTTTNNIVVNPGFESGVANWTTIGTSTVTQDTTAGIPYHGIASLKAAITAASSGTQTSGGQAAFTTNILINTQYQLTFEAKCSSVINTFTYGRDDVSGTPITNTSTANCNTSWQQYTWHFTTGGTITNPLLFFTMGTATSGNFWLDSVQLVKTTISGAQPYQPGSIQLRGVIDNPATFESVSNSTTAFQILSSNDNNGTSSLPLNELTVDTLNNNIQIGSQTASTNGIDLTLNNYNATLGTEPTETDGAMYYNSTIDQFRCGVNGTWENCGGLDISNSASTGCTDSTLATSCVPNNYFTSAAPTIPANYCTVGRVIHVFVSGIYTGTTAASSMTFSIRLGGTIIGGASGAVVTGIVSNLLWDVNFYITCDSTTTVTGEGNAVVSTTTAAANTGALIGAGTTTIANTSAHAIAPYINVGSTTDVTSITLEQFIVQGM